MLIIKTHFNIASIEIVCAIALHTTDRIYRIPGNCCTAGKISKQLFQFPVLIDLKSIFIIGHCYIIAIGSMESTRNIDRIVFCRKILHILLNCILIKIYTFIRDLQPGLNCSGINNFRCTAQCIGYRRTTIFIQLIIQICDFLLHIIRNNYRWLLINIHIQCDLYIAAEKLQTEIIVQHLVYVTLKLCFINLVSLNILHQYKLLL